MAKAPKRKPGRPPKAEKAMLHPRTIRFPQPMLTEIEAIQSARVDQPEFGALVRELVADGLAARKGRR